MKPLRHTLLTLLLGLSLSLSYSMPCSAQELQRITVSENQHYLQTADGHPFFYQGDTAWELFHRLTREEANHYLEDRARKGFNVIQAVALAELDGINTPNAYGHKPLINRNPATPDTKEGEQNDYWDNVDYIVSRANSLGMYVGLLPTWGRWWKDNDKIFNPQNAEQYGRWIAERYSKYNVIWILGGDRNPDNDHHERIIRAMARGIRSVDKKNLMTFHPTGWLTSSRWFHNDKWLAFNGRQSGHHQRYNSNAQIVGDFNLSPAKPIIELEPLYEDHPLEFRPNEEGHSNAWDVRRALYWSVFYGSAGVTYGHHSVWQMYDPEKQGPINRPLMSWQEALAQTAADDVRHLKELMLSRPYFSRIPSADFIVPSSVDTAMPGAGRYRFVATIDSAGSYAMVYAPTSRTFSVKSDMIKADKITAWWYCPRTGKAKKIGTLPNDKPTMSFTPPHAGEAEDWVLVIDDASKHYPAPGRR